MPRYPECLTAKFTTTGVTSLGSREVKVVASAPISDRVGDVLVSAGCVVRGGSVPVLVDHDSRIENIVGRARVDVKTEAVYATITFLDEGVSEKADLVCRLYKTGIATDVSVGFMGLEKSPIGNGGWRFAKWELYEISCVVSACLPEAQVIQRGVVSYAGSRAGLATSSGRRPVYSGDDAKFAADMRRYLESEARIRSSLVYYSDPDVARRCREREIEELRRGSF